MKIKPEFCTPFYYGHSQEDSKERYELIQEELLEFIMILIMKFLNHSHIQIHIH